MEDYRFRSQQSPRNEAPMNSLGLVSPPRNGNRMPQPVSHDLRAALPRRFTTDSGRVPTLSTLALARPPELQEYPTATQYKLQLLEKKKVEYEKVLQQKRRFEAEMQKLDQQQHRNELEMAQMQEDLGRRNGNMGIAGHQSEPTTPPEYRDSSGFPSMFSRPNRYSTSSLVSPPGFLNRQAKSLASPQSGIMPSHFAYDDQLPSRSVPGSRRNSDDDEDKEEALRQDPTSHRSTNALNRYSMPVTRRGNLYDNIDQTNAAGFLFRDDDSTMETTYSGLDTGDEGFPQLYSQKNNTNRMSTASMGVDLSALAGADTSNGWGKMPTSLHRSQQSLTTMNSAQMNPGESVTTSQAGASGDGNAIGARNFRHSIDTKQLALDLGQFAKENASDASAVMTSPTQAMPAPKLPTSYSTNDIHTVKNAGASGNTNAHAQQHLQNHNASMGRIPPGAVPKRHSRDLSGDSQIGITQSATFPSIGSALHANAPSFGPPATGALQTNVPAASAASSVSSPTSSMGTYSNYYTAGTYGATSPNGSAYSMPLLSMGMNNLNLGGYSPQNYTGYAPIYQPAQPRDSQQRVIQQRRTQDSEAMSRFANLPLEAVGGSIFDLCKDQHGCRYLQKQLENRIPEQVHMIWMETNQHVVELMQDPFGNYLCQKLLEFCNDDERTMLIQNAAPSMVSIALNQHGTRALQKMIEFVSIPEHIQIIVDALRYQVVDLIQDLNGNHVIQKCLNKLSAQDAQFIFDAVGSHCIEVGTHRHGCCVLQRCIDHASGDQKRWLIARITENALRLVQDPFGNYVVQYVIDLNEPTFTEPLVKMFGGKVGMLSRHKFSSNVIEKCLRCASDGSRDAMVNELLITGEMDRLLKDPFGNYVVQTALEHTAPHTKTQLVEAIRPILPQIRNTPYGRRLQAKIQAHDTRSGSNTSGQTTPADSTQGQISLRAQNRGMANNGSVMSSAVGYTNGVAEGRAFPPASSLAMPNPQAPRMNQGFTYPSAGVHSGHSEGQFF